MMVKMKMKNDATVVTVDLPGRSDQPISDAVRAQLKEKLRAAVAAAGTPPEGVEPPTAEEIDQAVEDMLLGVRDGSALTVSAVSVIRMLGRVINQLEPLPDAIKALAMGVDAARTPIEGHATGGHIFTLGSAWGDVLDCIEMLSSAKDFVQKALDCECFPGKPPVPNTSDLS